MSSRTHGCQRPFSGQQVFTLLLGFILIGLGFATIIAVSSIESFATLLSVYAVLTGLLAFSYFYCAFADVTAPAGGISCICMRATQRIERYCRTCQSVIPGFDHHCTFLNVCVGARTYFFFYTLALTGALLFTWQCVFSALIAADIWRDPKTKSDVGLTVLASLSSFFALSGVLSFGTLCTFHTYLLTQGIGTYDWILRRAEISAATQEREHSRQQQQQEEAPEQVVMTARGPIEESNGGADVSLVEIMPISTSQHHDDNNADVISSRGTGAAAMTRREEAVPSIDLTSFSSSVNANEVVVAAVAAAANESSTSSATVITAPSTSTDNAPPAPTPT